MKFNVGGVDRIARFILGFGLLSGYFLLEGNLKYFSLVGTIPLFTSIIKWCPIYTLFGINTCKIKKSREQNAQKKSI